MAGTWGGRVPSGGHIFAAHTHRPAGGRPPPRRVASHHFPISLPHIPPPSSPHSRSVLGSAAAPVTEAVTAASRAAAAAEKGNAAAAKKGKGKAKAVDAAEAAAPGAAAAAAASAGGGWWVVGPSPALANPVPARPSAPLAATAAHSPTALAALLAALVALACGAFVADRFLCLSSTTLAAATPAALATCAASDALALLAPLVAVAARWRPVRGGVETAPRPPKAAAVAACGRAAAAGWLALAGGRAGRLATRPRAGPHLLAALLSAAAPASASALPAGAGALGAALAWSALTHSMPPPAWADAPHLPGRAQAAVAALSASGAASQLLGAAFVAWTGAAR